MDLALKSNTSLALPTEHEALLAGQTSRKLAAHYRADKHFRIRLLDEGSRRPRPWSYRRQLCDYFWTSWSIWLAAMP